jgi:hypothetical protein
MKQDISRAEHAFEDGAAAAKAWVMWEACLHLYGLAERETWIASRRYGWRAAGESLRRQHGRLLDSTTRLIRNVPAIVSLSAVCQGPFPVFTKTSGLNANRRRVFACAAQIKSACCTAAGATLSLPSLGRFLPKLAACFGALPFFCSGHLV